MTEVFVGILVIIDFACLLAVFLYWIALDCFKDIQEAQSYVALINRGISRLKRLSEKIVLQGKNIQGDKGGSHVRK